jgi:hypothetical protein
MASCTTTRTIVSTRTARLTIDAATVVRISRAASGLPTMVSGSSSYSVIRSMAIVEKEMTIPRRTHRTGISHSDVKTLR